MVFTSTNFHPIALITDDIGIIEEVIDIVACQLVSGTPSETILSCAPQEASNIVARRLIIIFFILFFKNYNFYIFREYSGSVHQYGNRVF
jgi:hypothetical protein